MPEPPANGTRRKIDGEIRVYYDGYWIKHYDPPADTTQARKDMIRALTRRLFNHVEHGINIPGTRLDQARAAYESETDTERKRVKGAMLAGALFNRATDIFSALMDLKGNGVEITSDNTLMRECGQCLMEALELGKMVRHRGGDEGIDELWGEPFRAFSVPIEDFYESRYVKMAMAMRDIDRIGTGLKDVFCETTGMPDIGELVNDLVDAGKRKCEILRTDPKIFDVWPRYVAARERLCKVHPRLPPAPDAAQIRSALDCNRLLRDGAELLTHLVRARVSMPKSTREFLDRCDRFKRDLIAGQSGPRA